MSWERMFQNGNILGRLIHRQESGARPAVQCRGAVGDGDDDEFGEVTGVDKSMVFCSC